MQAGNSGMEPGDLIAVVKDAVRRAGISRPSATRDLQMASVQLTLAVVAAKSAGGRLAVRVPVIGMEFSAGGKITRNGSHTIDITLAPPEPSPLRETRGPSVSDALVAAITTIRDAMASAATGDDPWHLSAGEITISFAVTKTGTIAVGADGELASEITHTLRLRLAPGRK